MPHRSYAALESYYDRHRGELLRHALLGYNRRAGQDPSMAGVETAVAGDDASGGAQGGHSNIWLALKQQGSELVEGLAPC